MLSVKMPTRKGKNPAEGVTPKQLALARELARRWHLDLPLSRESDLAFIRAFLDAFALSSDNPFEAVLRTLRNARQLAGDGIAGDEIARKLMLPVCLAPVLESLEPHAVDRVTDLVLDERDAAAELGLSSL